MKASRLTWAGRGLSGLVIAFLIMDGAIKLVPLQPVIDALRPLGWPTDAATTRGLGVLLLAAVLLYAVPRTSLIGAVLLTGYLGGAIATNARVGMPLLSHVLFGVYVGAFVWLGLLLRRPALRAMLMGETR